MVLVIRGQSIRPIQNALKAINWAIHDMRLSEVSQSSKVFVQLPQRNCDDIPIRFDLNRRPALVINKTNNICRENTAADLKARLSSSLGSSFRGLLACGRLRMRVNLGQIQLLAKKKTTSDQLSWSEYAEALNECSRRGRGASLKTRSAFQPPWHFRSNIFSQHAQHSSCRRATKVLRRQPIWRIYSD